MRAIYYHQVTATSKAGGAAGGGAIEASALAAHAAELARHWRPLSLEEVHDHLLQRRPLPDRAVHVSFDDGFRDNLIAADIFEAHRIPWTLFAVADAVLDGYVPWYVRLAEALAGASHRVTLGREQLDLATPAGRQRFKDGAKQEVMAAPSDRHLDVLSVMLADAGMSDGTKGGERRWPFLSAEELGDLAGRGVEIGNHSASHPNLLRCTEAELSQETAGSQARLAAALARPVRFFAYPDGRHDRRVEMVTGATHDLAMATWTLQRPLAPLAVRRFPVGSTVADLRQVLAPGYPRRYRAMRIKWGLRRQARSARARLEAGRGA